MDKNAESAKMSHEALMIRINARCYWTFKIASGNSRQFNCRDESEPASSAATHCLAYNKIL